MYTGGHLVYWGVPCVLGGTLWGVPCVLYISLVICCFQFSCFFNFFFVVVPPRPLLQWSGYSLRCVCLLRSGPSFDRLKSKVNILSHRRVVFLMYSSSLGGFSLIGVPVQFGGFSLIGGPVQLGGGGFSLIGVPVLLGGSI